MLAAEGLNKLLKENFLLEEHVPAEPFEIIQEHSFRARFQSFQHALVKIHELILVPRLRGGICQEYWEGSQEHKFRDVGVDAFLHQFDVCA
jgi:hypothetical protein